jgi:hypothetical protein
VCAHQLLCSAKREEAFENLLDWNGKADTLRADQDGGIDSKDLSRQVAIRLNLCDEAHGTAVRLKRGTQQQEVVISLYNEREINSFMISLVPP